MENGTTRAKRSNVYLLFRQKWISNCIFFIIHGLSI
uniref:Uncharacterized protein n=1 Tax=Rhizophora mucronata TaxID=61149 RepID=A0A2P2NU06_RHIMU